VLTTTYVSGNRPAGFSCLSPKAKIGLIRSYFANGDIPNQVGRRVRRNDNEKEFVEIAEFYHPISLLVRHQLFFLDTKYQGSRSPTE
jgi:hypothetical protein